MMIAENQADQPSIKAHRTTTSSRYGKVRKNLWVVKAPAPYMFLDVNIAIMLCAEHFSNFIRKWFRLHFIPQLPSIAVPSPFSMCLRDDDANIISVD